MNDSLEEFINQHYKDMGYTQPWKSYIGGTKPITHEARLILLLVEWMKEQHD